MGAGIKKLSENVVAIGRALTLSNETVADNSVIPIGTLRCNPTTNGLSFKKANNSYMPFDAASTLALDSITSNLLKNSCVITTKIADLNVTEAKLANLSVTSGKLGNLAVTETKIANNAVTGAKLAENTVTSSKYANASITGIKIMENTIDGSKLLDNTIPTTKYMNLSVTGAKIANNTIEGIKLLDKSVTNSKLADGSVHGNAIADGGILTSKYADASITQGKIANGAIIQTHIAVGGVAGINLQNNSVTNDKLADNTVTSQKIADGAITGLKYANLSISKGKLTPDLANDIDNSVKYEGNNVNLKGSLNVTGNIEAQGNITGARVYNATYMDLAEAYTPGEKLEVGDIVSIREDGKVYKCDDMLDTGIVGVVSDMYAACYGASYTELQRGDKVAVGLIGKVPVKVYGAVTTGQAILPFSNGVGYGCLANDVREYRIGKALETKETEDTGLVMCLIYPN